LDCEPPFPREEGGYVTELDFALPTSAKDFRRFRSDELNADAPLTIYTETGAYKPNVVSNEDKLFLQALNLC